VSNYRVSGTINQALFGFGDAVCVPVVTWIANNYLNPLLEEILSVNNTNKIDYESNRRASIAGI
jgi:DNA (cytosine-5)-methyltransferase 1